MPGKLIEAIIFDFGGTLDTNGIHWAHKFFDAYQKHNIIVHKDHFIRAYIHAERQAGAYIQPHDSFFHTLNIKFNLQLEYLYSRGLDPDKNTCEKKELVLNCYNDVLSTTEKAVSILKTLSTNFRLGIASNFYGNLQTVLDEFLMREYFSVIFDSAYEKIRKPDPRVFQMTAERLGCANERSIIVGDSYTNDIEPGKRIGCKTVWLLKRPWEEPSSDNTADYIIRSLSDLLTLEL